MPLVLKENERWEDFAASHCKVGRGAVQDRICKIAHDVYKLCRSLRVEPRVRLDEFELAIVGAVEL